MDQIRTIIIGISGCSSSGKTTLARLLRDMFPDTFILHEDDFYKPESELPINQGHADWDCPEAISIPDLEAALAHVRATGTFPVSSRVPSAISPNNTLSRRSNHGCAPLTSPTPLSPPCPAILTPTPITTIFHKNYNNFQTSSHAGFLFTLRTAQLPSAQSWPTLDIKLFLRASRAAALRRRTARDGYVHMDGFWKDPPGYVEQVVWPNYVAAHRWLFEGGGCGGGQVGWRGVEGGREFWCRGLESESESGVCWG
ncbi:hypothetical protein CHGG_07966 [Chaetomium globosum CBS 148.51]|uniref:Phosphoribulokinase/uridine kinase domain-containing protein n=1 Tax=Chaetomium globosum (strain ATCC 6205 / CBS 148.51 / DSM 1962 / NBRC 6347 / NRRL 1970) TaxID=306901 RepID=Q2GVN8_CHAGB|nr:uncharacterized protein CHGG_07966 [Chaetomium globosum CBS 148.51]EAQ86713.1 hypothetical protein CHGG_07966 [Chaetomium globosum CBS 148.51]